MESTTTRRNNENPNSRRRPNILLAITGSVAAMKGPEIAIRLVSELQANVKIILTKGGENFWNLSHEYNPHHWKLLQDMTTGDSSEFQGSDDKKDNAVSLSIYYADDEWKEWKRIGDSVLHIDLRNWADILIVAPLSAHTLAKIANGLCDDTVSCVIRAWDYGYIGRVGKPIVLVPAMNTAMWEHPLTKQQLQTVQGFWNNVQANMNDRESKNNNANSSSSQNGVHIITPQVKTLACGEIGNGAMASVDEILRFVKTIIR